MNHPLFTSAFTTEAAAPVSGPIWVHLMPAGSFSARDGRGPFDAGDAQNMQAIIDASLARAGVTELVIDYDHQAVFGAVPKVGGVAPAAGWIKEMQVRGDGIWGRVEWTEKAAQMIRGKEYRYLSPVFSHDKKSKVLLIEMAALTNTPALDLASVAASRNLSMQPNQEELMEKLLAALGLDKGAGEQDALAAINSLTGTLAACATALNLGSDAKPDAVQSAAEKAANEAKAFTAIASAADIKSVPDADAASRAICTALSAKAVAGDPDPSKFVPMEMFTDLQTQVASLTNNQADTAAETAVTTAMREGKVTPAQKGWAMSYAKSNLTGFTQYCSNAPVITQPQTEGLMELTTDGAKTLTDEDQAVMSQMGLTDEQFRKSNGMEVG